MSRGGRVCWRVGYVQGIPLPCDLSHDACNVIYLPTGQNDGQTPVKILPFQDPRLRAVIIRPLSVTGRECLIRTRLIRSST